MTAKFKSIGIDYSMGGMTGSTMDSHRLIQYSEKFGVDKQNELVEELFNNYFCQEKCCAKWQQRRHERAVVAWLRLPAGERAEILKRMRCEKVGSV